MRVASRERSTKKLSNENSYKQKVQRENSDEWWERSSENSKKKAAMRSNAMAKKRE